MYFFETVHSTSEQNSNMTTPTVFTLYFSVALYLWINHLTFPHPVAICCYGISTSLSKSFVYHIHNITPLSSSSASVSFSRMAFSASFATPRALSALVTAPCSHDNPPQNPHPAPPHSGSQGSPRLSHTCTNTSGFQEIIMTCKYRILVNITVRTIHIQNSLHPKIFYLQSKMKSHIFIKFITIPVYSHSCILWVII